MSKLSQEDKRLGENYFPFFITKIPINALIIAMKAV